MSLTPVIIERLQGLGIPTTSFTSAAYYVRDHMTERNIGNKVAFEGFIKNLTDVDVVAINAKEAELIFGYLVQESVRRYNMNTYTEIEECIQIAKDKTTKFLQDNPWVCPAPVTAPEIIQADGSTKKVRVPRGSGMSKKDRCIALYEEYKGKPGFEDKHKMIELFMKELELSKPGATTYEFNCRKGKW